MSSPASICLICKGYIFYILVTVIFDICTDPPLGWWIQYRRSKYYDTAVIIYDVVPTMKKGFLLASEYCTYDMVLVGTMWSSGKVTGCMYRVHTGMHRVRTGMYHAEAWYRYKPTWTGMYLVHTFYPKYVPRTYFFPQVCTEYVPSTYW